MDEYTKLYIKEVLALFDEEFETKSEPTTQVIIASTLRRSKRNLERRQKGNTWAETSKPG
jgi:hypothetical protein